MVGSRLSQEGNGTWDQQNHPKVLSTGVFVASIERAVELTLKNEAKIE